MYYYPHSYPHVDKVNLIITKAFPVDKKYYRRYSLEGKEGGMIGDEKNISTS